MDLLGSVGQERLEVRLHGDDATGVAGLVVATTFCPKFPCHIPLHAKSSCHKVCTSNMPHKVVERTN